MRTTGTLKFKVISPDWEDVTQFEIIASSNNWQASLEFWGYEDFIRNFADQLTAFSGRKNESAAYEIGKKLDSIKPDWAYYLLIRAFAYHEFGRSVIEIEINNNLAFPDSQTTRFCIFSEVAQINTLGKMLLEWDPKTQSEFIWETQV